MTGTGSSPSTEKKVVRFRIVVVGRVQGVSFRTSLREVAIRNHVIGWVRNRPDGSVEAVIQGSEDNVGRVISWARRGPAGALVSDLIAKRLEALPELRDFQIYR